MKIPALHKITAVFIALLFSLPAVAVKKQMRADSLYSFEFDSLFVDAVCLRMAGNDSAALEGFLRCYELNPGSAAVNYEIGSLKLQGGKEHADEGLRYMKRAVDNDPGNYYYLTILARLYYQYGKAGDAVAVYNRILKQFPDRDEPIYDLALLYNGMGEYRKSNAMADKLLRRMGWSRQLFFLKARNYISMGDDKSVLKIMDDYIEDNPLDYSMWVYKGDVEMELGLMDAALSSFEKSMEISPGNGEALMSLCNYYDVQRNSRKVEEYLAKIFASKDVGFETKDKYMRAAVLYWRGDTAAASKMESSYKAMVEADRQNYLTHLAYARFLNMASRQDESIDELRTAIYLEPSCMDCWKLLLKGAIDKNDEKLASEVLSDAVDAIPDSPLFHFYKGTLAYFMQQPDSALESLLLADSLLVKNTESRAHIDSLDAAAMYSLLGEIYHNRGDEEKTLYYMGEALLYNPYDLVSMNNYAYYLAVYNRKLDDAEKLSFVTVKREPLNPTFLDTYAYIMMKRGDYKSAYFYIMQALEYDDKENPNAEILEHLGDIQYFMGQTQNAVSTWRKAKDSGSPNPKLDDKINSGQYVE